MSANTLPKNTARPFFSAKDTAVVGMMIALTIVMCLTPIGVITLPMIRITIAHVPILITVLLCGLHQGLAVALAFGLTTLMIALTAPVSVLDPLFVNPLVSVLPRLLIPVTAYYSHKGLARVLGPSAKGRTAAVAVGLTIGNLTNTFGVYTMLYLLYAARIFEMTSTEAITLIIGLISTSTLIKCVAIVAVCTPLVAALQKALRHIR